jgi:hypothetical protein
VASERTAGSGRDGGNVDALSGAERAPPVPTLFTPAETVDLLASGVSAVPTMANVIGAIGAVARWPPDAARLPGRDLPTLPIRLGVLGTAAPGYVSARACTSGRSRAPGAHLALCPAPSVP